MSITKVLRTNVAVRSNVTAEWDAAANRLRVAASQTDETLAVYSRDELPGVMGEVAAGRVIIPASPKLPTIVESLMSAGVINVVRSTRESAGGAEVFVAEVIL